MQDRKEISPRRHEGSTGGTQRDSLRGLDRWHSCDRRGDRPRYFLMSGLAPGAGCFVPRGRLQQIRAPDNGGRADARFLRNEPNLRRAIFTKRTQTLASPGGKNPTNKAALKHDSNKGYRVWRVGVRPRVPSGHVGIWGVGSRGTKPTETRPDTFRHAARRSVRALPGPWLRRSPGRGASTPATRRPILAPPWNPEPRFPPCACSAETSCLCGEVLLSNPPPRRTESWTVVPRSTSSTRIRGSTRSSTPSP